MEYGAHLPLIGFDGKPHTLKRLLDYTEAAERLGFQTICANDHLVFPRPWFDGPTALASVLTRAGQMTLATTVSLPVVRGPFALAKTLGAIDLLSEGRLVVGVGPGSSARDYATVGIPFEERWKRLDEAVRTLRALWTMGTTYQGKFYSSEGIELEPPPAQKGGPPIWIGSWGSAAGLRRTARLGDGWLASAYNTTPEIFGDAWKRLQQTLSESGKDPDSFPNAIATMSMYVTEDRTAADRVIREIIQPAINRSEEELRQRLLVGPVQECAEKLLAYQEAGAQRVFVWPVTDELRQLEMFQDVVTTLVRL